MADEEKTIRDFGEQWTHYPGNSGYYASVELLADFFGPLLSIEAVRAARVGDVGSGTGRIVNMLLDAGAAEVVAVEPSEAIAFLRRNTEARSHRVHYVHGPGESLPAEPPLDLVVSIGVLHHIPRPAATVAAAFRALRPGGRMLVWVYGREGNELYVRLVTPVRWLTSRLPHATLAALCRFIEAAAALYLPLVRRFRLPLRDYLLNVYSKLSREHRRLILYDQLNPAHAHYYSEDEARSLLASAGFRDVVTHHRHGYSWTVAGEKP